MTERPGQSLVPRTSGQETGTWQRYQTADGTFLAFRYADTFSYQRSVISQWLVIEIILNSNLFVPRGINSKFAWQIIAAQLTVWDPSKFRWLKILCNFWSDWDESERSEMSDRLSLWQCHTVLSQLDFLSSPAPNGRHLIIFSVKPSPSHLTPRTRPLSNDWESWGWRVKSLVTVSPPSPSFTLTVLH